MSVLLELYFCIDWANKFLFNCLIMVCSETGELYAKKLANFIEKRLKYEKTATVSNFPWFNDGSNQHNMGWKSGFNF